MSLHAQLFPAKFNSTEKLIIVNVSELLLDALTEIISIKEFNDSINNIDIESIPSALGSIVNYSGEIERTFSSYILADSILRLKFIINKANCNKYFFGYRETLCILDSIIRLENVYKDSLNRYLSI